MESNVETTEREAENAGPRRERLPDTRSSLTHKFCVNGHEGYITAGLYEDGRLGEVFIKMAKQGSTVSGLTDTVATLTSLCLQYGVPVKKLAEKLSHTRFEPSGWTKNEQIREATSIVDYIFRWLDMNFGKEPESAETHNVQPKSP
ncbi:MAG: hypothetical protein GXP26_13200 [Planctomycetes bacterium]|nr:hypothetical protein [Planctomycetota bacterium]